MTFSKLGIALDTIRTTDPKSGKEKISYTPQSDPQGKPVIVPLYKTSRLQGTYVIGATGTGKSGGILENLVMQDVKQGIGVCVLDPHGDLIDKIIARVSEEDVNKGKVILLDFWNPEYQDTNYYPGLNIYQCDNPADDNQAQGTYERIKHLFNLVTLEKSGEEKLGVRVSQGIRNSAFTFIDSSPVYGCTMLELPMLFTEDTPRANLIAHLRDDTIRINYWEKFFNPMPQDAKRERADMVLNKIEGYTTNRLLRPVIGQSRTTINFRDVMDKGQILLIKLPGEHEEMTELLGSLIIAQILGAAFSRKDIPLNRRRQLNIYCDEFELYATDDFTRLLKECRKYGMAVTIAHQSRDFLDLRNQAASLQVANLIILRIAFKDAEKELAGSFKITPQAAWEEELEEEQLEIREQERLEMMEVIDGEEEIDTPVKDVVGHLLRGGTHPDAVVNSFTHDVLSVLNLYTQDKYSSTKDLLNLFNRMFYAAMTGQPVPMPSVDFFLSMAPYIGCRAYVRCLSEPPDYLQRTDGFSRGLQQALHFGVTRVWDYHHAQQALEDIWEDGYSATNAISFFDQEMSQTLREGLLSYLKHELDEIGKAWGFYGGRVWQDYQEWGLAIITNHRNYAKTVHEWLPWYKQHQWKPQHPDETWYHIDFDRLEWEEDPWQPWGDPNKLTDLTWAPGFGLKEVPSSYAKWLETHNAFLAAGFRLEVRLKEGQEYKFYREADLENAIETQFQEEKERFLGFIQDFKDVMAALAEHPLRSGSGIRQPRKRQQILLHPEKTFPHPRVAIPHPQRPYQDVKNEIANELANLPNYVARIRITDQAGELVEHTIKTLNPEQGVSDKEVDKRITRIKQQMIANGYCRAKDEIDAEIRQRHKALRQDRQPQQPPPPPKRFARQVPLQGN